MRTMPVGISPLASFETLCNVWSERRKETYEKGRGDDEINGIRAMYFFWRGCTGSQSNGGLILHEFEREQG
jgi:hypothetical protein